jgi:hypothetical protein
MDISWISSAKEYVYENQGVLISISIFFLVVGIIIWFWPTDRKKNIKKIVAWVIENSSENYGRHVIVSINLVSGVSTITCSLNQRRELTEMIVLFGNSFYRYKFIVRPDGYTHDQEGFSQVLGEILYQIQHNH